jgi:hypothetical protein
VQASGLDPGLRDWSVAHGTMTITPEGVTFRRDDA